MSFDPSLVGWRRLTCAVLVRAHRDAHSTKGYQAAQEAGSSAAVGLADDGLSFLHSDGARWLVEMLDLDPSGLDYALARLPPPASGQLEQLTSFDLQEG